MVKATYKEQKVLEVTDYFVKTHKTIREVAKDFKLSKSTIFKYLRDCEKLDYTLYKKARVILDVHTEEKYLKGGLALKYKHLYANLSKIQNKKNSQIHAFIDIIKDYSNN